MPRRGTAWHPTSRWNGPDGSTRDGVGAWAGLNGARQRLQLVLGGPPVEFRVDVLGPVERLLHCIPVVRVDHEHVRGWGPYGEDGFSGKLFDYLDQGFSIGVDYDDPESLGGHEVHGLTRRGPPTRRPTRRRVTVGFTRPRWQLTTRSAGSSRIISGSRPATGAYEVQFDRNIQGGSAPQRRPPFPTTPLSPSWALTSSKSVWDADGVLADSPGGCRIQGLCCPPCACAVPQGSGLVGSYLG